MTQWVLLWPEAVWRQLLHEILINFSYYNFSFYCFHGHYGTRTTSTMVKSGTSVLFGNTWWNYEGFSTMIVHVSVFRDDHLNVLYEAKTCLSSAHSHSTLRATRIKKRPVLGTQPNLLFPPQRKKNFELHMSSATTGWLSCAISTLNNSSKTWIFLLINLSFIFTHFFTV